jgi:hypothetical protein
MYVKQVYDSPGQTRMRVDERALPLNCPYHLPFVGSIFPISAFVEMNPTKVS